jgi:cyclase
MVLGMDVKRVDKSEAVPSGFEVVIHGGRKHMGLDALDWAKTGEALGAGEICLNSIDADGTKDGYDLELTRLISRKVRIPVIASGGAGNPGHMAEAFVQGGASAALIASIVHYGEYTIARIKREISEQGVKMRMVW